MTTRSIQRRASRLAAIACAVGIVLSACSGAAAPAPSTVSSPEAAAALVVAANPGFAGLGPLNPDAIGQCCFYTAATAGPNYTVTVEVGWGDCPAGCIDRHDWVYTVTPTGAVTLESETGRPVPSGLPGSGGTTPGAGSGDPGSSGVTTSGGIAGRALAGPVCPVQRPNDPACADRPVAGATIRVMRGDALVLTLTTDAAGQFSAALQPGDYTVVADSVDGLMGTPAAMPVTVSTSILTIDLSYDTGIR